MSEDGETDIRQEILDSAKRMLSQLDQIELNQEPEIPPEFVDKPREFLTMLSSLQTDESALILEDVTKWGEQRREKFDKFEAPLLRQVEDNQSVTEAATDSTLRMTTDMDGFKDKLAHAKGQIASMGESVARAGQEMMKARIAGDVLASGTERDIPHLQLETNPEALLPDILEMRSKDEELIKRMKAREEHFMAAVNSLSGEVEELSREVVDAKTEILELQRENERLRSVIGGMKEKAELVVKPLMKMDIIRTTVLTAAGNIAFEVPGREIQAESHHQKDEKIQETERPPVIAMRTIEFFATDIPPEETECETSTSMQRTSKVETSDRDVPKASERIDGELAFEIRDDGPGRRVIGVSEEGAKALAGKSPQFLEDLENEVQTDIQQIIGLNAGGVTENMTPPATHLVDSNTVPTIDADKRDLLRNQEATIREQEEELRELRKIIEEQAKLLKKHGIEGPDIAWIRNRDRNGPERSRGNEQSEIEGEFTVTEPTGAAGGARPRFGKENSKAFGNSSDGDADPLTKKSSREPSSHKESNPANVRHGIVPGDKESRSSVTCDGAGELDKQSREVSRSGDIEGDLQHSEGGQLANRSNGNGSHRDSAQWRYGGTGRDIERNRYEFGNGAADNAMIPLGIRQKANNEGFRLIYRDNNDAVVVDADYRQEGFQGLYVIGKAIKIQFPPVRIRGGFSRPFIKACQDPNVSVHIQSLSKPDKPAEKITTDFLAAHEERMRRISTLRRNLVGLLENESASPTSNIVDCPHAREPWMWSSFPVRPLPPIARIYTQHNQNQPDLDSGPRYMRPLLANRRPVIAKLPAHRRKFPAHKSARPSITPAYIRLGADLNLTPR